MYELIYNGRLHALFTTEEKAREYAKEHGFGTFSIMPPGTFTSQPEFDDEDL